MPIKAHRYGVCIYCNKLVDLTKFGNHFVKQKGNTYRYFHEDCYKLNALVIGTDTNNLWSTAEEVIQEHVHSS